MFKNKSGIQVLELRDIEKGRNNVYFSVYKTFCEKYIPCVLGKIKFKTHCYSKKLSELCTVLDEAIAILVYSNNCEQWLHKMVIEKKKKDKEKHTDNKDEHDDSNTDNVYEDINSDTDVPPQKYFVCKKGRGHTYSKQGYIYFNEMCRAIVIDRKNNGDKFDEDFRTHMNDIVQDNKDAKKGKRKKVIEEEAPIRAYVDGERGRGDIPLNTRLEYSDVPVTSV
jgi:hypothetical protein